MSNNEFVPKVSTELVMKANDVVGASNVKGDPTIAIAAALADQYRSDELRAVAIRVMALSKLFEPDTQAIGP